MNFYQVWKDISHIFKHWECTFKYSERLDGTLMIRWWKELWNLLTSEKNYFFREWSIVRVRLPGFKSCQTVLKWERIRKRNGLPFHNRTTITVPPSCVLYQRHCTKKVSKLFQNDIGNFDRRKWVVQNYCRQHLLIVFWFLFKWETIISKQGHCTQAFHLSDWENSCPYFEVTKS